MLIVPAIDIIDGKCVRLSKGDFSTRKDYSDTPVDVARRFEDFGITHLHLVDLDGAKNGKVINWFTLETIANKTSLSIDFSGGIKCREDIIRAIELGAKQIAIGSMSVKNPRVVQEWLIEFGSNTIILGADSLEGKIAIHGWQESSDLSILEYIDSYNANGAQYYLCTDVACDGMLQGPSTNLYKQILETYPSISLIASGGVSCKEDLLALKDIGCYAAIVGKAYYEGKISLEDMATLNRCL
jgi:phosphoribosylformimino-5-aminoimidazole carboxamide ribotide isomerase